MFGSLSVRQSPYFAVLLVLCSEISMTSSASLAKTMFSLLPPEGVTALRLGFSALTLCLVFQPWRKRDSLTSLKDTLIYGFSLGIMNLTFYMAIQRIPLGIAVGTEIMGPLSVAVLSSRRLAHFGCILLAVCGLALLLPLYNISQEIDTVGLGFAAAAGLCWALYIVFGKKTSGNAGTASIAVGMLAGAALIFPCGILTCGTALFEPRCLLYGFLLGIISSALPYGLEIVALSRIPARTFGTLMSLSPCLAALSGLVFLGEKLNGIQWVGLIMIVIASMCMSATKDK